MRKNLLLLPMLLMIGLVAIQAQITTPAPSPGAKVMQSVGLDEVTIEYSRPSAKGRTIFAADGLVPFGDVWRTGANQVSSIHFSGDVMIGEDKLGAGKYAILTKPGKDSWAVHFYEYDKSGWNTYLQAEPSLVFNTAPTALGNMVESFTMGLNNITDNSAHLNIEWEKTRVAIPLTFEVDAKVLASIDRVMAGPSNQDYFQAATYYHTSGKDLEKALKWINMATAGDSPRFWQVRRKALILADMGKKADAIATAKLSMQLAKEAGNKDYVRMNEKSLKEWGAM